MNSPFVCKDNDCNCGATFLKFQGLQRHGVVSRKRKLGIPVNMPEEAFNALPADERFRLSNAEKAKWAKALSNPTHGAFLAARRMREQARYQNSKGAPVRTPEAASKHAMYMRELRAAKKNQPVTVATELPVESPTTRFLRLSKELAIARQDMIIEMGRYSEAAQVIKDLLNPPDSDNPKAEHSIVDRAAQNDILTHAQFGNVKE